MEDFNKNAQELYNLVWESKLETIAEENGISIYRIRSACSKNGIPIPDHKYWKKKEKGEKAHIIPPRYGFDPNKVILIEQVRISNNIKPKNELKELIAEIEKDKRLNLKVSPRLIRPHELVANYRKKYYSKASWDTKEFRMLAELDKARIHVSSELVGRASRYMDALLKLFIARGHKLGKLYGKSYVIIFGIKIKIALREKNKRVKDASDSYYNSYSLVPTGKLVIKLEEGYRNIEMTDGNVLIEDRLAEILAKAEIFAKKRKEEEIEWEIRRKEQEIIREEKRRKAKIITDEVEKYYGLFDAIERLKKANLLRDYLNKMQEYDINGERKEFIEWGLKKADWIDPIINFRDPLLGDFSNLDSLYKDAKYTVDY